MTRFGRNLRRHARRGPIGLLSSASKTDLERKGQRTDQILRAKDMRRHARGKLRGCARHLAQGHDGLDADHAGKWAGLRGRYRLGAEPYDAHNNIIAGAASAQAARPRWAPGFLAAYNAGPARWEDYLATGRPLPIEAYLPASLQLSAAVHPTVGSRGLHRPFLDQVIRVCRTFDRVADWWQICTEGAVVAFDE